MTVSSEEWFLDNDFVAILAEYYRTSSHALVDRRRFALEHAPWSQLLWEHWRLADELRIVAVTAESTARPDDTPAKVHGLAPSPGDRIGPYLLLTEIGRGGMGVVYRARQEPLGRIVAVKVMLAGALANSTDRRRFWVEAVAASRLRHEGIVAVYDIGEQDAGRYIAMELVEGGTLQQRLHDSGPLTIVEAASLIRDAAQAVDHAHSVGIVHRDLKPSNILLDANGRSKVGDFGLSRTLESATSLTLTGEAIGTPSYMPPEQTGGPGSEIGPRCDVYSLGATLYALLTGRPPFCGESAIDTLWQVRMVAPPDIRSLRSNVPRDLETIVRKCLEKDPFERYDSAAALANDLDRFLEQRPIAARPATWAEQFVKWTRRHPTAFAAGSIGLVAAVLLLTITTLLITWSYRNERAARNESRLFSVLAKIQELRSAPRKAGFRERALDALRTVGPIENSLGARTVVISTLIGLDASLEWNDDKVQTDVSSVAFSPDGEQFLLGGTPTAPSRLGYPGSLPQPIGSNVGSLLTAFSPDGTPLEIVAGVSEVTGQDDKQRIRLPLSVWDLSNQSLLCQCDLPSQPTLPGTYELVGKSSEKLVCCNSDATRIAAVVQRNDDPENTQFIAMWDGRTGRNLFFQEATQVTSLGLASDGMRMACGTADGRVEVWDTQDRSVSELPKAREEVLCVAFAPHGADPGGDGLGQRLLVGRKGGFLQEWDLTSRITVQDFQGAPWDLTRIAISPDGTTIAAAGRWMAILWDRSTGTQLLQLTAGDVVTGLAWSPDGRRIVVGSRRAFAAGGARLWRLEDGRGIRSLRGLKRPVLIVAFSPDGHQLAAVSQDGQVMIWDTASSTRKRSLTLQKSRSPDNVAFAFNANGARFAVCSGTEARLIRTSDGAALEVWPLPSGLADALSFQADDSLLCVRAEGDANAGCEVNFRHLGPGGASTLIRSLPAFAKRIASVEIAAAGRMILLEAIRETGGTKHSFLVAIDGQTASELWSQDLGPEELFPALDPTGQLVTFRSASQTTSLLTLQTGQPAFGQGDSGSIRPFFQSLSPRAEYLVALGFDDERTKGCSLFRRGRDIPLLKLGVEMTLSTIKPRFDISGQRLAWGNADGTVLVADLDEIQRELTPLGLEF